MLVRSDWMLKSYDFAILFLENFKICAFLKSLSILPLDEPVSIGLSLCERNVGLDMSSVLLFQYLNSKFIEI